MSFHNKLFYKNPNLIKTSSIKSFTLDFIHFKQPTNPHLITTPTKTTLTKRSKRVKPTSFYSITEIKKGFRLPGILFFIRMNLKSHLLFIEAAQPPPVDILTVIVVPLSTRFTSRT
ncbi:hypothetical protein SAMN03080601_00825 [Alkalitalea saponilacus]|uniref:Uncharacterized protein n=1 Tax=Alkalitalea saponilacus TaxID=889453 RepID=A0A1T5CHR0_9BACT|nr:hypothetical protein SAMN03080601_00825 [Alkalitalea saponilacus]